MNTVLNLIKNIQPLLQTHNSSKGGKWPSRWLTYKGKPLHPDYIKRNIDLEIILREELQNLIWALLEEQGKG